MPDEAIRYLIAGGDYAAAEQLVQQHRYALMNTAQWSRLERWLNTFPGDFREHSALLTMSAVALAVYSGKGTDVVTFVQTAEQLLAGQEAEFPIDRALQGELAVFKGLLAITEDDGRTVITFAQRGLQMLPGDALHLRAIASAAAAAGKQMSGQFDDGRRLIEDVLHETEWPQSIQAKLMDYLCMIAFMQGDLATTQIWAEHVEQIADERRLPDSLNMARHFLGVIHYLRHEFDAAEPYLRALLDDHALAAPSYLTMGTFALALIHDSWGDFVQADAIMAWVSTYFRSTRHVYAVNMFQAFAVDLAWRRQDFGAAQRQRIGVNFAQRPPLWFFYIPQLTPIKLLLAKGSPEPLTAARTTLEDLAQRMAAIHRNVARTDILALLALVCDAQGDDVAAERHLGTALILAQKGRLIQPFVDLGSPMAKLLQKLHDRDDSMHAVIRGFVAQILDAFPTADPAPAVRVSTTRAGAQPVSIRQPRNPLTARELDILVQLAGDSTPAEMAAENVVSVSTIRSQIKSIYRKLDVHSRMEAVNRGRELNLL